MDINVRDLLVMADLEQGVELLQAASPINHQRNRIRLLVRVSDLADEVESSVAGLDVLHGLKQLWLDEKGSIIDLLVDSEDLTLGDASCAKSEVAQSGSSGLLLIDTDLRKK